MKKLFAGCLLVAGTGLLGCGANTELENAIPNSDTVTLDMEASDSASTTQALDATTCHPHLFMRTREVVHLLNRHIVKVFGRVDEIIATHPKLATGKTHVWEHLTAQGEVMVKVSLTKTEAGSYTFETDMKKPSDPDSAYVAISSGTVKATDGAPHSGTGTLHLDLTALTTLVPEEKAGGVIDVDFTVTGATKRVQVKVTNFDPDVTTDLRPPRSGNYVFERTRGVGGSLKFQEDVVLFCPANPDRKVAQVQTVARWANLNGQIVGRSDSRGTGGQIASGNQWLGMTCFDMTRGDDTTAERYWQMKLEDGSGNVVKADATYSAADTTNPVSSCDAAFGAVPALGSNANDFDFSKVNFSDDSSVPYPGQPTATASNG